MLLPRAEQCRASQQLSPFLGLTSNRKEHFLELIVRCPKRAFHSLRGDSINPPPPMGEFNTMAHCWWSPTRRWWTTKSSLEEPGADWSAVGDRSQDIRMAPHTDVGCWTWWAWETVSIPRELSACGKLSKDHSPCIGMLLAIVLKWSLPPCSWSMVPQSSFQGVRIFTEKKLLRQVWAVLCFPTAGVESGDFVAR